MTSQRAHSPYRPAGETKLKCCLVGAAICLVSTKVFNVLVPIALKMAVDDVGDKKFPLRPVVMYGSFRFLTDSTKEARDCLYNYVSTYASRKISLRVFTHVQNLSLRFHLNRKTGAVLRAVSRGSSACASVRPASPPVAAPPRLKFLSLTRLASALMLACLSTRPPACIVADSDLLRYITFQIFPIFFEVRRFYRIPVLATGVLSSSLHGATPCHLWVFLPALLTVLSASLVFILSKVGLVTAYLLTKYPWYFGTLTAGVIVAYVTFTISITEWRNKYRRIQTQNDDAFNQKAIDSLLNFETVKYFCAEQHISEVYDSSLIAVADANIASQVSLSLLNAGQNFIISAGVALAMMLAGRQASQGKMSVGDFVLINVRRVPLSRTCSSLSGFACPSGVLQLLGHNASSLRLLSHRFSSFSCTLRSTSWAHTTA